MRVPATKKTSAICSACGAGNHRPAARVCGVCGKFLSEGFQPLDAIRSSYGLQRMALLTGSPAVSDTVDLFGRDHKNTASELAWACFVYSLVPYLGIIFIPFTLLMGAVGYEAARRDPSIGGGRRAAASFWLSFVVLAVQVLLWWLLYLIPTLGHGPL